MDNEQLTMDNFISNSGQRMNCNVVSPNAFVLQREGQTKKRE
jgi:hypothetical protein